MSGVDVLPGEGEVKYFAKVRRRRECEVCGEPADRRITFLLSNARRNPDSSGYGRDDISYCADDEKFACEEHKAHVERAHPTMDWCSTWDGAKRPAVLLYWQERELTDCELAKATQP